jgi:hypothetical protein
MTFGSTFVMHIYTIMKDDAQCRLSHWMLVLLSSISVCLTFNLSFVVYTCSPQRQPEETAVPRRSILPVEQLVIASNHNDTISTQIDNKSPSPFFKIDILSIGSITRPHYQQAQLETAGRHPAVRNFFPITERNDTEATCHVELNMSHVYAVHHYCSRKKKVGYPLLNWFNLLFASPQYLKKKGHAPGWLCAQKRPIDGLVSVISQYRQRLSTKVNSTTAAAVLPDYLFVVDDDTYVNMDPVLEQLLFILFQQHDGSTIKNAHYIAGCLSRARFMNFSFPYGGWGTFVSRAALENWMRPIHCTPASTTTTTNSSRTETTARRLQEFEEPRPSIEKDPFVSHACGRLSENRIGEANVFRNGMSVSDLLYAYTMDQAYLDVVKWSGPGFCLHSDTAFSYFVHFYRIGVHASVTGQQNRRWSFDEDRITGYKGSTRFLGQQLKGSRAEKGQCNHRNDTLCTHEAELCHYITPERMRELYQYHHDTTNAQKRSISTHDASFT